MTHSALASRYASALVDVATGPKSEVDPHQLLRDLRGFEEVFAGSAELRNALTSPSVPPARKRAVVGGIGEKLGVSRIARNFCLCSPTIAASPCCRRLWKRSICCWTSAWVSSAPKSARPGNWISASAKQCRRNWSGSPARKCACASRWIAGCSAGWWRASVPPLYDGSVRGQIAGARRSALAAE